jgi:hypothetical protein
MKSRNRVHTPRPRGERRNTASAAARPANDSELQPDSLIIAHMTTLAFMRRISHEWHLIDLNRFGDLVSRTAEAAGLSYLTTFDKNFGTIRVFPVRMMERIYRVLSGQFPNWPQIVDLEQMALPEGAFAARETLLAHERVATHLQAMKEAARDEKVQSSIGVVLEWLAADIVRLRETMPAAEPQPAPATA